MRGTVPTPILVLLALLVAAGPVGLLVSGGADSTARADVTLAGVARGAGCALDRLTRANPEGVLLFENRTGMRSRIAATAYLSSLTCPRVDRATLRALALFRARRQAFGQGV